MDHLNRVKLSESVELTVIKGFRNIQQPAVTQRIRLCPSCFHGSALESVPRLPESISQEAEAWTAVAEFKVLDCVPFHPEISQVRVTQRNDPKDFYSTPPADRSPFVHCYLQRERSIYWKATDKKRSRVIGNRTVQRERWSFFLLSTLIKFTDAFTSLPEKCSGLVEEAEVLHFLEWICVIIT